ncbi:KilA-N domain-containing protein [Bernardetia sp. MNP-M8]|uniref:KilA-N domain-containing protein n=1 Tax=Bernardetia sp. MNP-M8 TaxID=3127470 RepID=UPI0030CD3FE6
MAKQKKQIEVENKVISIVSHNEEDYISLTDMIKNIEGGNSIIENWLRNKNTIEYLGVWETVHNESFNSLEFEGIKNEAGTNRFYLSAKRWIEETNAIGIISKTGRYGGTYAHQDIALEFGSWVSPTFKVYLIKEYRRLKEAETNQYNLEWNIRRLLSKTNYAIHTDAIKEHIIPKSTQPKNKNWLEYAEEADLLNVALFGYTAKEWREVNTEAAQKGLNMRDFASINELIVLSNIESMNATMINKGLDKFTRFSELRELVEKQISILNKSDTVRAIKKFDDRTYLDKGK